MIMWLKKLYLTIIGERENILQCSGGCGRTLDAGKPTPDYSSRMLPLFLDGVPRYERYKYLTEFKCFICYKRDQQLE